LPDREAFRWVKVRPDDDGEEVAVERGRVVCEEFPFVVLTSNGERDLPPALLRRCLNLRLQPPTPARLAEILEQHLHRQPEVELVAEFLERQQDLATDQLLNAVYLTMHDVDVRARDQLRLALFRSLSGT
jgi:MoxR-like ATPase